MPTPPRPSRGPIVFAILGVILIVIGIWSALIADDPGDVIVGLFVVATGVFGAGGVLRRRGRACATD